MKNYVVTIPENAQYIRVGFVENASTPSYSDPTVSRMSVTSQVKKSLAAVAEVNEKVGSLSAAAESISAVSSVVDYIPSSLCAMYEMNEIAVDEFEQINFKAIIGEYVNLHGKFFKEESQDELSVQAVHSDFIPVIPGEKLRAYGQSIYLIRAVSFFDINKNIVSFYPTTTSSLSSGIINYDDHDIDVPGNAAYAIVQWYGSAGTGKPENIRCSRKSNVKKYADDKHAHSVLHDALSVKFDCSTNEFEEVTRSYTSNNYIYKNGKIYDNGGVDSKITEFTPVTAGEQIRVVGRYVYDTRACNFYDHTSAFISCYPIENPAGFTDIDEIITVPPKAEFAVASYYSTLTADSGNKPAIWRKTNKATVAKLSAVIDSNKVELTEMISNLQAATFIS